MAYERGDRVRVHFNLHKGGFVIRHARNIVGDMEYTDAVCVRNAKFVHAAGTVKRIREQKRRKVCAWVEGELCDCQDTDGADIHYDPYENANFVIRGTDRVVTVSAHVAMRTNGERKPITKARV